MTSTKNPRRPERIRTYIVPSRVLQKTQIFLKTLSRERREAIAYWTGKFRNDEAVITRVIFPDEFRSDCAFVSAYVDLNTALKICESIHRRHEYLLIQLHTHPFEAFHSWTDDLHPISHRVGFTSIVIPYFARYPLDDLNTWKVYEYKGLGKWRELSLREIRHRFSIAR